MRSRDRWCAAIVARRRCVPLRTGAGIGTVQRDVRGAIRKTRFNGIGSTRVGVDCARHGDGERTIAAIAN